MSDGKIACKFWTWQKKILAIALTIIAIGGVWAIVAEGGKAINTSMNSNFNKRVATIATALDSIQCVKRNPIDSLMLSELKGIRMDQRKSAFMNEKTANKSTWKKAEAAWKSDSLFNERYPPK